MFNMEELLLRFPHIGIKIFEELDNQNVTLCRTVTTSWKSFIDGEKAFWIRKIQRQQLDNTPGPCYAVSKQHRIRS